MRPRPARALRLFGCLLFGLIAPGSLRALPAGDRFAPARPAEACVRADSLTVLSWNIYQNRWASRIEASLRRHMDRFGPEVLFIQEAPGYRDRAFHDSNLFAGYHAFYAPAHHFDRPGRASPLQSTGQLILSRYPFDTTAVYELPVLPSRARDASVRRNVVYGRLALCSGGTLGLYNLHLENRALAGGRTRQVRHLLDVVRRNADEVVLLGGDFNTFLTPVFERSLAVLQEAGFRPAFRSAWNGWLPRLDYFMVRGAGLKTGRDLDASGSDHDPILVVLRL